MPRREQGWQAKLLLAQPLYGHHCARPSTWCVPCPQGERCPPWPCAPRSLCQLQPWCYPAQLGWAGAAGLRHGAANSVLPGQPQPHVPKSVVASAPCWGLGLSSGPQCPHPAAPALGPMFSPPQREQQGSCLPSSAWLNLNWARLLHRSLPAEDKDGQASCPEPSCSPPCRASCPAWGGLPTPPARPLPTLAGPC